MVNLLEPKMKKTAKIISGEYEQAVIDTHSLFDGVTSAKRFMFDCDRKKRCRGKGPQVKKKWAELFNDFSEGNSSVVNLVKVIEFIFCLAGSSAPVERLFSITNSVWSLDRSRMLKSTVQVLLFCRVNIKLTCPEFYEKN
jgi:hypothetical protein